MPTASSSSARGGESSREVEKPEATESRRKEKALRKRERGEPSSSELWEEIPDRSSDPGEKASREQEAEPAKNSTASRVVLVPNRTDRTDYDQDLSSDRQIALDSSSWAESRLGQALERASQQELERERARRRAP